ncbi:MAG: ABC transporter ATP-binding protein [Lachnospiraceae bacterium]
MEKILDIRDLTIHFEMKSGIVEAVNHVSFSLNKGETLGLVGETGAGKTTTALGIMNLVQTPPGRIVSGEIMFENRDLRKLSTHEMRKVRGNDISMIFQDPMTSLNPIDKVGDQIAEVIRIHQKISPAEATVKAQEMLELVGIDKNRYNDYPHQFSGGMKQRVVIAIALSCNPKLLIADEPTTARDVTIQAQEFLDLMNNLKKKMNTSMILITHDLGVVAEVCDKVAIIYAGEIVEYGTLEQIFLNPLHPYTKGLFSSIPNMEQKVCRLTPIPGMMPDPTELPDGCKFAERCVYKGQCCDGEQELVDCGDAHLVRCCKFHKIDSQKWEEGGLTE